MIRKSSLAKGMFSTKISLTKGIRSKTGAAHPRQNFFGVSHLQQVSIGSGIGFDGEQATSYYLN